ncbi:peptidase [Bacillus sp. GX]|uniref:Peptidase n=1 Tax=Bacillus albus TaxID=2026189 RepID=A0ABM7E7Y5_9BACI|nr:peptidase [Bacillus albus]AZQ49441.1 peptidase [Bacillus albus]WJE73495.1 peptidase [Bacillus albus]
MLKKDNNEVIKLETAESDKAIFEALYFEKYKVEEIQVLN